MSEASQRYRKVAEQFTQRLAGLDAAGWDAPTPCEGWTVRDIVRHVVQGSEFFLGRAGGALPPAPSADEDPMAAWSSTRDAIVAALEDPEFAGRSFDSPMGRSTLERSVGMFGVGDVLVHTWDVARATGQDEALDADEVHRLYTAMEPNEEMMRRSGMFGPKVDVGDDADEQTQLIAFTGRRP